MARPLKEGLDYWNKDVSFYLDKKVKLLRSEFGAVGMYALDYILCEIYRNDGYFVVFDKDWCSLVSDGAVCGGSSNFIEELVKGCVRRSFFDKRVFDMFKVITSKGIQKRYIRMASKRKKIPIIEEYFLLDLNDTNEVPEEIRKKIVFKSISGNKNQVSYVENEVNGTINTQSKVKESKVKESKSYARGRDQTHDGGNGSYDDIFRVYLSITGRNLSNKDMKLIDEFRNEGCTDQLIIDAMQTTAKRTHKQINSMNYFKRPIRERLATEAIFYPSTSDTSYIESVLDAEWMTHPIGKDEDYVYDD